MVIDKHELSYNLVSLLTNNPTYINRTIVEKEMLENEYQEYFELIKKQYLQSKRLDIVEIKQKGYGTLYQNCIYNGIAIDIKDAFQSYQQYLLDIYKKEQANILYQKWNKNMIDDSGYFRSISNLQSLNVLSLEKLTKQSIIKTLKRKENLIQFKRWFLLKNSLKLEEHDLLTLSGDTGMGKSSLALNLMEDLSQTYPCIYFNMEMSKEQIHKRIISIYSQKELDKISNYTNQEQRFIDELNFELDNFFEKRNIYIVNGSQTLNSIVSTVASFNQEKHFIVFVDHAGLISTKGTKGQNERMTLIYQTLRKVCLDYNCTLISLCQLNRESVKNNPEPNLSSLKDSSEIEQSSSKVGFIFCTVDKESRKENYYFKIAKNRNGIKGVMGLNYNKQTQKMEVARK